MSTTDQPAVSRGLLMTLAVVGGLAALAAVYIFVVQPLLGDEEAGFSESLPAAPVPEASDLPSETPTFEPQPVPETVEVFNARDPFQQLVVAADASGAVAGSAPPAATGPGGEAPPGSTDPAAPPGSAQVGGTTVELREVITDANGEPAVVVVVNGTVHEANEGDTFAERFRVLDIDGDCATFLFGDSRFTLCEGDTIRK